MAAITSRSVANGVVSRLNQSSFILFLICAISSSFVTVESSHLSSSTITSVKGLLPLQNVNVLITAPPSYAPRLQAQLEAAGATVLSCATVVTEFLSDTDEDMIRLRQIIKMILNEDDVETAGTATAAGMEEDASSIDGGTDNGHNQYDYVAFTSRKGIQALLNVGGIKLIQCFQNQYPTAIALGVDLEELVAAGVDRSAILAPSTPTPDGIVEMIQSITNERKAKDIDRSKRLRILCPVPKVIGGLTEPPVVPNFLSNLQSLDCEVDRINSYVTRWTGPSSHTKEIVDKLREGSVDVIGISSTAEVEGLKLFCIAYDLDWDTLCNSKDGGRRQIKVAAHGPVTASGAQSLGLPIHAISKDSSSFAGMVGAVAECVAGAAST